MQLCVNVYMCRVDKVFPSIVFSFGHCFMQRNILVFISHESVFYCSQVYEEALKVLPTTKMFSLYAKFYTDAILADREDPVSVLSNTAFEAGELTSRLLEVYENAEQTGCITKELAYEYISFYLQIGRIHEARDLAKKLCSGRLSEAADVWTLRISTELKWLTSKAASIDDDDLRSISELFRNAMTRVSASKVESLWLMVCYLTILLVSLSDLEANC